MSGVEVRPLSRLPASAARPAGPRPAAAGPPPYTSRAMQITTTPAPKSTVVLEIELPPERLEPAIDDAVRRLSRRTRVPASGPARRPGPSWSGTSARAPSSTRPWSTSSRTPTARPSSRRTSCRWPTPTSRSSRPRRASRSSSRRPSRSARRSRSATTALQLRPEIETIDDARVDKVVEELRDQNATLAAVEDRGAQGRRLRRHRVRRDARRRAVRGRDVGADAADPRPGAADPGLRGQPRRASRSAARPSSTSRSRTTTPRPTLAGETGPLRGRAAGAAREGPARARRRLRRHARRLRRPRRAARRDQDAPRAATRSTGPATGSPTGSSTTPSPTRRVELPDILVDQEVEVMHDEFRGTLARQGITEEAYLKAVDKTDADLHAEFRPGAEKRVRTLLVLSKVAEAEGVTVPDAEVEAEVARGRERYAGRRASCIAYFDSRARPGLHPQHAPPQPGRREPHRRVAGRPPRALRRCRTSRTGPASAVEGDQAAAERGHRRRPIRARSSTTSRPPAG